MFTDWLGTPLEPDVEETRVAFGAGEKTDYFRDPASETVIGNAPYFWRHATRTFTLTGLVQPGFQSTFDAGAFFYYADEEHWSKLAYEFTDMDYPAIVSVVTRGRSDDSNGEPWPSGGVWLRVSRNEGVLGFYYGSDGKNWKMHRLLTVPGQEHSKGLIGLLAQSPTGAGCRVTFEQLSWTIEPVSDFRKGV